MDTTLYISSCNLMSDSLIFQHISTQFLDNQSIKQCDTKSKQVSKPLYKTLRPYLGHKPCSILLGWWVPMLHQKKKNPCSIFRNSENWDSHSCMHKIAHPKHPLKQWSFQNLTRFNEKWVQICPCYKIADPYVKNQPESKVLIKTWPCDSRLY